ncbi:hypothetical protein CAP35_13780 [Chitinophagaceae bacterium IBVUCB1]|nr:hypothetical protein CAP35_13780 [Chitinophagaceae bacterium IBVUCB1]
MQITNEQKTEAAKVAANLGVSTLYVNVGGEFFTEEGLAIASVSGDRKKILKLNFEAVEIEVPAAVEDPIAEATVKSNHIPPPPASKYAGMTLDALQKMCEYRGVAFAKNAKEANLIGKLEAWDKAQSEEAEETTDAEATDAETTESEDSESKS